MPEQRRARILSELNNRDFITGTDLAGIFDVTRQVIVKDIAILRAEGQDIIATPKGYFFNVPKEDSKLRKVIAICHHASAMQNELAIIVDYGGKVIDVIVEHPVYGEIRANLMIDNRLDLESFIKKVKEYNAKPLSSLTDGVHLHTVEVVSEEVLNKIKEKLKQEGFLLID